MVREVLVAVWILMAVASLFTVLVLISVTRRRRKEAEARVPLSIETIDRAFVSALAARRRSDWVAGRRSPILGVCVACTVALIAARILVPAGSEIWFVLMTVVVFLALGVILATPILRMVEEFHSSLLTDQELFAAELRHALQGHQGDHRQPHSGG